MSNTGDKFTKAGNAIMAVGKFIKNLAKCAIGIAILILLVPAIFGHNVSQESLDRIENTIKANTDATITDIRSSKGLKPTITIEMKDEDRAHFGSCVYEVIEVVRKYSDTKKAHVSITTRDKFGEKTHKFYHVGKSKYLGTLYDYRKDSSNPKELMCNTVDDLAEEFPELKVHLRNKQ